MRRQGQGKKLIEAARLLARGDLHLPSHDDAPPEQEINDALAAFGAVLDDSAAPPEEEPFWLWPEHAPALDLWFAVQTQWRYSFAGATGLCYAGVQATMEQRRVRSSRRSRLFGELQTMERAALAVWAERRAAG